MSPAAISSILLIIRHPLQPSSVPYVLGGLHPSRSRVKAAAAVRAGAPRFQKLQRLLPDADRDRRRVRVLDRSPNLPLAHQGDRSELVELAQPA
jgi:hypothetical protein